MRGFYLKAKTPGTFVARRGVSRVIDALGHLVLLARLTRFLGLAVHERVMHVLPEPVCRDESRFPAVELRLEFEPHGCKTGMNLSSSSLAEGIHVNAVEYGIHRRCCSEFQNVANVLASRFTAVGGVHRLFACFRVPDESILAASCHCRNE